MKRAKRVRTRIRRGRHDMADYRRVEVLSSGLSGLKDIGQLRTRMLEMADDDELWVHISNMFEADKQRHLDYTAAQKYVIKRYGK